MYVLFGIRAGKTGERARRHLVSVFKGKAAFLAFYLQLLGCGFFIRARWFSFEVFPLLNFFPLGALLKIKIKRKVSDALILCNKPL